MRLVVLGGSGAATPELFDALREWRLRRPEGPSMDVVLVGRSGDKLALIAEAGRQRLHGVNGVGVTSSIDRRAALVGADVVLNQARIGGLAAREFDETFPRPFGLPGEETMGPGGFANALRTVAQLRRAWQDVAEVAPTAQVINLTNPAGIVVQAAAREFGLDIVEVCDSPVSLTALVSATLGIDERAARRRYLGMNHVGWWVPESQDQLDAIRGLATGLTSEQVGWYGALPGPYVRYYAVPQEIAAAQRDTKPRASVLREIEGEQLAAYRAGEAETAPRRGAGWYGLAILPLVDAWTGGDADDVIVGRARNDATGLPPGSVIESASAFTHGMVQTEPLPTLPPLAAELLRRHAAYEAATVDAIAQGAHRDALIMALALNPMVNDIDLAARLVDVIIASSPE